MSEEPSTSICIREAKRQITKNATTLNVVIVLLSINDTFGGRLANLLMSKNWKKIRNEGGASFVQGIVNKIVFKEILRTLYPKAGKKLHQMSELAVVVIDQGIAEVFPV